jgi:hypothetical protein
MTFLMTNGAPATFAVDRTYAEVILGTADIQEIPLQDLGRRDWEAAEAAGFNIWSIDEMELPCFAVAC